MAPSVLQIRDQRTNPVIYTGNILKDITKINFEKHVSSAAEALSYLRICNKLASHDTTFRAQISRTDSHFGKWPYYLDCFLMF